MYILADVIGCCVDDLCGDLCSIVSEDLDEYLRRNVFVWCNRRTKFLHIFDVSCSFALE